MEPRLVISRHQAMTNVIKEEWTYISRSLPINTTIGIVVVSDEDSDWNGFIENCQLNPSPTSAITKSSSPLYLEEVAEPQLAVNFYSSLEVLNSEIESLMNSGFLGSDKSRFYRKVNNQKKFFIRTATDLKNFSLGVPLEMEIHVSDKGMKIECLKYLI